MNHHSMAVSIASALPSSLFDYANSVLLDCPQKHIVRLQPAQHAHADQCCDTAVLSFFSSLR